MNANEALMRLELAQAQARVERLARKLAKAEGVRDTCLRRLCDSTGASTSRPTAVR
jgi:hypothetical protein